MSDFTYEQTNGKARLETYEWDNTWIEHAGKEIERVLYVGDSISCNIRRLATEKAQGLFFDGFGTSKAVDNPFLCESVSIFAKQQGDRKAVLFNNGLHGWHLEDESEYARWYEDTVRFLIEEFSGTPIVLVLTTHVADEQRNARVLTRNRVVREIAEKYGLSVIDLYTPSMESAHLLRDGVHYLPEGNDILAQALVNGVKELL